MIQSRLFLVQRLLLATVMGLAGGCTGHAAVERKVNLPAVDNRIVLVGDGFIDQSRNYGYLEMEWLRAAPIDHPAVVRNLGWSGDSVTGAARTPGFENPAGIDRLIKEITVLRPTMIVVGYGMVDSFDGDAGIKPFVQAYNTLLDRLITISPNIVLLSPTIHEDLGNSASSEVAAHNQSIERYTTAIASLAAERKLPFVNLHRALTDFKKAHPHSQLTSNGITLNEDGYRLAAQETGSQLGFDSRADFDSNAAHNLRLAVLRANQLFYRRERPANDHSRHWTYIGGDFALYDQQLAKLDDEIAALRRADGSH